MFINERKQDCSHVDRNQLDDPLSLRILTREILKRSTILVCMLLKGKGSYGRIGTVWFPFDFGKSITKILVSLLSACRSL